MGYTPPPPGAADLIRQDLEPFVASLYRIAAIYGVANQYLVGFKPDRPRAVEHGRRTWADLHVEALGWGLLLSVFAALLVLAWMFR